MDERTRRRALRDAYRAQRREAAVYLLRNTVTGRGLLGSTVDLASLRNRLEFARATATPSALDLRLADDARRYGVEAFELEVVEPLEVAPTMTEADVRADLAALEQLCRERLDPSTLY